MEPAEYIYADDLSNRRIAGKTRVFTPHEIKELHPLTQAAARTVVAGRSECEAIISGQDYRRMLVIVGPCSIHDPTSALEYARRLVKLRKRFQDKLCIIMRTYLQKPRTRTGWKGLMAEPTLVGGTDFNHGRKLCRRILLEINTLGLPVATEVLDPATPQVIDDLISWGAIGARTTESQTHREMASGLSFPVGIKNGTGGSVDIAINAMVAAREPHYFLGVSSHSGEQWMYETTGNQSVQIILRGGSSGPNYDQLTLARVAKQLEVAGLPRSIVVDCSHANAEGDYRKQADVLLSIMKTRAETNIPVNGVMIESHLHGGKQAVGPLRELEYGVSITDPCVGWDDTVEMLERMYNQIS